jgi:hypothetical protein
MNMHISLDINSQARAGLYMRLAPLLFKMANNNAIKAPSQVELCSDGCLNKFESTLKSMSDEYFLSISGNGFSKIPLRTLICDVIDPDLSADLCDECALTLRLLFIYPLIRQFLCVDCNNCVQKKDLPCWNQRAFTCDEMQVVNCAKWLIDTIKFSHIWLIKYYNSILQYYSIDHPTIRFDVKLKMTTEFEYNNRNVFSETYVDINIKEQRTISISISEHFGLIDYYDLLCKLFHESICHANERLGVIIDEQRWECCAFSEGWMDYAAQKCLEEAIHKDRNFSSTISFPDAIVNTTLLAIKKYLSSRYLTKFPEHYSFHIEKGSITFRKLIDIISLYADAFDDKSHKGPGHTHYYIDIALKFSFILNIFATPSQRLELARLFGELVVDEIEAKGALTRASSIIRAIKLFLEAGEKNIDISRLLADLEVAKNVIWR